MAYFSNSRNKVGDLGLPTVGFSYLNMGSKNLYSLTITQTFFERIELGFAYNVFDVGSLHSDIRKLGLDMGPRQINLFHFNIRYMLIKEDSFGLPLPAITAGVHLKYNADIASVNNHLGGLLKNIGYDNDFGVDYTLTASKTIVEPLFNRPLILTGGLRFTKAAQLGLLGFGEDCHLFFEGSVCYMPLDNLVLAYEFRMKESPYNQLKAGGNTIIGKEDNWHGLSASWIINDHLTVSGFYGILGTIANTTEDHSFAIQVKYEF